MRDLLIWVDEEDNVIGYGEKMETHIKEQLHRAFSIFIFNWYDCTMLIHKRADGKYHSGGLWTNACCSHPRKGESLEAAAVRRMREELGIELESSKSDDKEYREKYGELTEVGCFRYYKKYDICAEHEIDHVFYFPVKKQHVLLKPAKEEIDEIKWISLEKLQEWIEKCPEDFTFWFKTAFDIVNNYLVNEMNNR